LLSATLGRVRSGLERRPRGKRRLDRLVDRRSNGWRALRLLARFRRLPAGLPAFNGHTGTRVPDIAGHIGGANDLVIFTQGNHFPALLGGSVHDPFRDWAKADPRFADLVLDDIAVVTLPQPIIVAAMRHRGLKLGNAIIDISIKSGFYPDIIMGGAEPLRELRSAGLVKAEARVFARNAGLALVVRKGNPLNVTSLKDLLRPEINIVVASASEPGARVQYRRALEGLMGEGPSADLFARETVTFEGRLGIQHRDVLEALAKNHANVGIIFRHLAQYTHVSHSLVETVDVPEAERFSSTIAVIAASAPLRPRAATAFEEFEEFFLDIARTPYPQYGLCDHARRRVRPEAAF
jgi:extracellular solute-binding protein